MRRLFAHLTGAQTKLQTSAPNGAPSHEPPPNAALPARWLPKDDTANPFDVEGFDCLAFVQSMRSVTQDQQVAESFVALRHTAGAEYAGKLPEQPVEIACNLQYAYQGEVAEGALYKSSQMEEKWDIYLYGDRMYFCRSWTGWLSFVTEFSATGSAIVLRRIWAPRELAEPDHRFVVQQVDYLIQSHLLRRAVPHPLPTDLPREPEAVALYSFSQYGRMCCFATYEDTVALALRRPQ